MIMNHRIHIETYGCAFNVADGEAMAALLERAGFCIVDAAADADAVVLNTCTVKDRTWNSFRQRLSDLRDAARAGGPAVILAGCVPPVYARDELIAGLPAIGPDTIDRIAEVVEAALDGKILSRIRDRHDPAGRARLPVRRRNPLVEILPISRGCLSACSFCQTRLARGRLRSFPRGDVMERARRAVGEGVREIWVTSQDAGAWGRDRGERLPGLLAELCGIDGDFRVRLGMSSPAWICEDPNGYLDALAHPKMFKFLHAPLQSGSDRVLADMKRGNTAAQFEAIARAFTERFPDGTFMTDVIVGYPTETEEDFGETMALLERCGIGMVNRSNFSGRPGTAAARLEPLPPGGVLDRSLRLEKLVRAIARAWHERRIGRREPVLPIEHRGKATLAHNAAYRPVFIEGRLGLGEWVEVGHVAAADYHLKSKIAAPADSR